MPYKVTLPDHPGCTTPDELMLNIETKPAVVKYLVETYCQGWSKAQIALWKKGVVYEKIRPPKKSDWRVCAVCEEQFLRNDIVEHIRGYHEIERTI